MPDYVTVSTLENEIERHRKIADLMRQFADLSRDEKTFTCTAIASIHDDCAERLAKLLPLPMPQTPAVQWPHVATAERIAREAHAGQKEESTGDDYIHHIERVLALVATDPELRQSERADAAAAAWLHDVIEDTDWTAERLLDAGIPHRAVSAVVELTRVPPYDYESYIEQIKESGKPIAIAVKLADLRDHLRPNCPERLRPRYEAALCRLMEPRE